jgi:tripartite-type tricarboxylate transporter receptor subunit TctC
VPTFQEAGLPAIDLSPWEGIIAPANTPPAIVDLIYRHAVRALKQPEVLSTLAASGIEPVGSSPQEFREHIHQQLLTLRRVLKGPLGKPAAANPSPRGET